MIDAVAKKAADDFIKHYLSIKTRTKNQEIVPAPPPFPLLDLFLQIGNSYKEEIQGFVFQDRAFESEEDKDIEKHLKSHVRIMERSYPSPKNWNKLSSQMFQKGMKALRVKMLDFYLNLAASDPLEFFAPEEMNTEGNIFHGPLPAAWIVATLCMGSIHLFYKIELQPNCLNVQTFADMQGNDDEFLVTTLGAPSPAWINMPATPSSSLTPSTFERMPKTDTSTTLCYLFRSNSRPRKRT